MLACLQNFAFLSLLCLAPALLRAEQSVDILIYGATPAGISSAVSAAKEGKSVVVLNPEQHVGGMISAGLGASDVCQTRVIGGFSRHFFEMVGAEYQQAVSWRFEAKVAQKVLNRIIAENKITIIPNSRLVSADIKQRKITSVTDQARKRYQAKIFVDASYEGDLLALTKVPYAIGREASSEFNESLAGVFNLKVRDQFPISVPARDQAGKLLDLVSPEKLAALGTGDKKIMAYNFRPCITKDPNNSVAFSAPAGYQASQFALISRYLQLNPNASADEFLKPLEIPGNKFDLNNRGAVSTDFIGANYAYAEGSHEARLKIRAQHRDYTLSLLYFLSHDASVPIKLRDEINSYGFCKDEFTDSNNFPSQLYVREARRMRGSYILTQSDLTYAAHKDDPIALASCPIESHHVQRVETDQGVKLEGWVSKKITPYQIPYRSCLPQKRDLENLAVAVAISATHIANSSLRMEPTYMIIGESLGLAASMAIENRCALHDINFEELRKRLIARGQILEVPPKALKYAQAEIKLDQKNKASVQ